MKRTELKRGKGLARGTKRLTRKPTKARSRKDTIPPKVRKLVLERDGYACVCCGVSIVGRRYSLQHRVRRSQGGQHIPENLIVVLGWGGEECHGRIDLYKDPSDEAKGYRLPSNADPAAEPVLIVSEFGSGAMVWLAGNGRYSTKPPRRAAA